ncbi:MAG: single-stranded DNA-binding protein [Isosphaeraceae bacterium]
MADLNKVFLMGRLTFDPELRRTPGGTAVTELRMATSRNWMGRDGERREEKLFIDVTVWDRQAENCCQYLRKGSPIHVEGYLKMETWDDKNTGEKRSKIRVQAERIQFLDSRRGDASNDSAPADDDAYVSGRDQAPRRSAAAAPAEPRGPGNGTAGRAPLPSPPPVSTRPSAAPEDRDEEDIPF